MKRKEENVKKKMFIKRLRFLAVKKVCSRCSTWPWEWVQCQDGEWAAVCNVLTIDLVTSNITSSWGSEWDKNVLKKMIIRLKDVCEHVCASSIQRWQSNVIHTDVVYVLQIKYLHHLYRLCAHIRVYCVSEREIVI